jgi:hypothetical protein
MMSNVVNFPVNLVPVPSYHAYRTRLTHIVPFNKVYGTGAILAQTFYEQLHVGYKYILLLPHGFIGKAVGYQPPNLRMMFSRCVNDGWMGWILADYLRRVLNILGHAIAMPVDVLPGLRISAGELIWGYSNNCAILEVQLMHRMRVVPQYCAVEEPDDAGLGVPWARVGSQWMEEEVVDDAG